MPEAFNVAPRQRSIPDVSSQKITTPLCHHLVAFIPLSLRRVSHLSSRSNVPFLWRTIRVCPRDRFYFAPCHLSCPVTVEHCFLWRSMLDVPIALRFSRYFPSLSLSLSCFPIFPARLLFLLLLLLFLLYVPNRGIKKEEAKNGKIEIVGYPDRCYLNLFLMMLNHPLSPPIDLVRVSEIALQSFFQMYRRLVGDCCWLAISIGI